MDQRVSPFWSLALIAALVPAELVAQAHSAPACPAPAASTTATARWVVAYSTDSTISLRVPPGYRRDPHYADSTGGRWTAPNGRSFIVGQEDLRAERVARLRDSTGDSTAVESRAPDPELYWLPEGNTFGAREGSRVLDGYEVVEHSACREAVAGMPALIEAALVSGGYEGRRRRPGVLATFRPSSERRINLQGEAPDQAGQRELLQIVRTLRIVR